MKRLTGSLRLRLVLSHLFVVVVAVVATALLSRSLAGSFFEDHLADMARDPSLGGMSPVMAESLRQGFTQSFGRALTIAAIVYTDIAKDGMLAGPNLKAMAEMASAVAVRTSLPVSFSTIWKTSPRSGSQR